MASDFQWLDKVGVNLGTEEGCGATGMEAVHAEWRRVDAGGGVEISSHVAEGIGDPGSGDAVDGMGIVMECIDGSARWCAVYPAGGVGL